MRLPWPPRATVTGRCGGSGAGRSSSASQSGSGAAGTVVDDLVGVPVEGAARADDKSADSARVDLPAQPAGAVPGGVAQGLALGCGEVHVRAAAPSADRVGVAGERLAVARAEHGEHVGAVGDRVRGPVRRRGVVGVLGPVQVDDNQAGGAGGDTDVVGGVRPTPGDAVRVGGGALFPRGDGGALVSGSEGEDVPVARRCVKRSGELGGTFRVRHAGGSPVLFRMGRENRGGGRPCWGVPPPRRCYWFLAAVSCSGRSGAGRR